jgi:hypothetical protein
VPGTALRLTSVDGSTAIVSYRRLGAQLDPCRLRASIIAADHPTGRFVADVRRIDMLAGLVHVAGGLYQATSTAGTDDRWFVTHLPHEAVVSLLSDCPLADRPATDAMEIVVKPDLELGVCAVRVSAVPPAGGLPLDELATWVLTTCLVEELLAEAALPSTRS